MDIPIKGMTCQNCVRHVTDAISKVPGVTTVVVDLQAGVAHVDGRADLSAIRASVAKAGYEALAPII